MKSEKLGKSIFRYKSYTFASMEKLDIRKLSLEQITELILKYIPNHKNVSFTNKKFDPRNYRVNFSKIEKK